MSTPKDYFKKMGLESSVEVQALTGVDRQALYRYFNRKRHKFNCILISAQKVKQNMTRREELEIATQEFVENGGDIKCFKMGETSKCEL